LKPVEEASSLEGLLDRVADAARDKEDVSLDDVLDSVGRRSFGPMLLLPGLITLAPLVGDVPGVPSMMGVVVLLTSGQLLFNREHFWLPGWLLSRRVRADKLQKAVAWLHKPARYVDRLLRPRLEWLVNGVGTYLIALVSAAVALVIPLMEVVPFSANGAGIVLSAFGLALISRDGLLALTGLLVAAGTVAIVLFHLL
jgi:hypothetical protein